MKRKTPNILEILYLITYLIKNYWKIILNYLKFIKNLL